MNADPKRAGDPLRLRSIKGVPFCWQSKAVRRAIREAFDATHNVASALAVYDALTEIASDEESETFATTHAWIQRMSGVSTRSIQRILPILSELGLVGISTPRMRGPSTYTLPPFGHDGVTFGHGDGTFRHGAKQASWRTSEESQKKGSEESPEQAPALPSQAGSQVELIPGTTETAKPAPKERQRDELFDGLASACGSDARQMTRREARACAVALAEIKKACPGLTVAEIQRRAKIYREAHKTWALTASALCAHWGECDQPARKRFPERVEDYTKF